MQNICVGCRPRSFASSKRFKAGLSRSVMTSSSTQNDLAIVGPGVLGSVLGYNWLQKHEDVNVVGITNSDTNHQKLKNLGLQPIIKDQLADKKFPNVVFCAPPSGSDDYPGEVKRAIELWDGSGTFIFTGSSGIFAAKEGELDENSPIAQIGTNPRHDKLIKSEEAAINAGGNVLRLVGLYHAQRGPHTFFMSKGQVERPAGYVTNLIHYEDAVSIAIKILEHEGYEEPFRGTLFLGCDNQAITFQEMMQACESSGVYGDKKVEFTGPQEVTMMKTVKNDITRKKLQWTPKYESFLSFMQQGAEDIYSQPLFQ